MAATVAEGGSSPPRSYGDLKSKPTEAMPKHSLFGSNIERLDEREKQQLLTIDLNKFSQDTAQEQKLKRDRYKVTLPDHLSRQLSGYALKHSKQELVRQAQQAEKAMRFVDTLEEKSKYFAVGSSENQRASPRRPRDSAWISAKHIENSDSMNILGAGGSTSYNHNKYQPRSAVHQYSGIGDPLRLGMEFPVSQSATNKLPFHRVERMRAPDHMPKEFYMKRDIVDENDPCAVKLPPNIRHQFGTRICQNVLSDPIKVEKTMSDQHKRQQSFLKSSQPTAPKVAAEEQAVTAYESLGAALRLDFFPGQTYNHKKSVARSVYTDEVYKRRVPDTDKYRYQRDYLSTWAEQNVLREKVKKAWDAYLAEAK